MIMICFFNFYHNPLKTLELRCLRWHTENKRIYLQQNWRQNLLVSGKYRVSVLFCPGTKTKQRLRGIRPCWHGVTPAASSTTPLRRSRHPGAWSRSGSTWIHCGHPWSRGWTSLSGQSIPVLSAAVRILTEILKWIDIALKKKNIYFANSKNNYNTMCKHRGGFPEGQSPIVLDTLSNAEYNIKYLFKKTQKKTQKQFTIYYRSTIMNIHLFYQCH